MAEACATVAPKQQFYLKGDHGKGYKKETGGVNIEEIAAKIREQYVDKAVNDDVDIEVSIADIMNKYGDEVGIKEIAAEIREQYEVGWVNDKVDIEDIAAEIREQYGVEAVNDEVDIDEIALHIREQYGVEAVNDEVDFEEIAAEVREQFEVETVNDEDETLSASDTVVNQLNDESSTVRSCATCARPRRVINVNQFKRGQHISMQGQHANIYIKKTRTLKSLYKHHAIVKDVVSTEGNTVTMILIHFSKTEDRCLRVFQETKTYDLGKKELFIIEYVHPKYNADQIINRAESILQKEENFGSYNPLNNNCEHFATWCVVGEGESFQVQGMTKSVAKVVTRILSCVKKGRVAAPAVAVDSLLSIFKIVIYMEDYRKGQMCRSCLLRKLLKTIPAAVMSVLFFNCLTILMSTGVGSTFLVPVIVSLIGHQIVLQKIQKALCSPFTVDRVRIKHLNELSEGDVIVLPGTINESIVSEVDADSGCIGVIRYAKKKIVEENINVDALNTKVFLLDCKHLNTFPKDVVVSRARCRMGETKWRLLKNRSAFAYWAKVKTTYDEGFDLNPRSSDASSSGKVSLFVEDREIHRHEDLQIGDVVQSSVIGRKNNLGILSSLKYLDGSNGRKFEMEVIIYSSRYFIKLKTYIVDLNKDFLYVKVYNPAQCYDMERRAENAKRLVGQKGKWWTTRGFIRFCIERKRSDNET